jgi:hypothetical protein
MPVNNKPLLTKIWTSADSPIVLLPTNPSYSVYSLYVDTGTVATIKGTGKWDNQDSDAIPLKTDQVIDFGDPDSLQQVTIEITSGNIYVLAK